MELVFEKREDRVSGDEETSPALGEEPFLTNEEDDSLTLLRGRSDTNRATALIYSSPPSLSHSCPSVAPLHPLSFDDCLICTSSLHLRRLNQEVLPPEPAVTQSGLPSFVFPTNDVRSTLTALALVAFVPLYWLSAAASSPGFEGKTWILLLKQQWQTNTFGVNRND